MEAAAVPGRPRFGEMEEEPVYTPLPRDYASDFGGNMRSPAALEQHCVQPAAPLFAENEEEAQRDLDTPAFMRRIQF